MKWPSGKQAPETSPGRGPQEGRAAADAERWYFVEALSGLLTAVRETLAARPAEGSEEGVAAADALLAELAARGEPAGVRAQCERRLPLVARHLARLKKAFLGKEGEYREIIDILTRGLAAIRSDNLEFTERIFHRSENLDRLTEIEDMRAIKHAIREEVGTLRKAVRDKQAQDGEMIGRLTERVASLESELDASLQASSRDGLTGLYNEKALDRYLKLRTEAGKGPPAPFSMMVVDIDNFDKIVKTYSPELGQRVILAAAQECRNLFNRDEFLARYQKGTFVAVLPSVPRKAAVRKARELCRAVAVKRYQIDEVLKGHTLSFTVSVGVSAFGKGDTAAAVSSRAVQALYNARRSGPNHVVSDKTVFHFFKKGGGGSLEDL